MNVSTGKTPFKLILGYTPSLFLAIPPPPSFLSPLPSLFAVNSALEEHQPAVQEAREAVGRRGSDRRNRRIRSGGGKPTLSVGDLVMVDQTHQQAQYKARGADVPAAKKIPGLGWSLVALRNPRSLPCNSDLPIPPLLLTKLIRPSGPQNSNHTITTTLTTSPPITLLDRTY
jgi:hypothetical protein